MADGKCTVCHKNVSDEAFHLEEFHKDKLNGMTGKQYLYHQKNKYRKDLGVCSCGKPKPWNESKGKYEYYCMTDEHRAKMRQDYQNNINDKYGTDNLANDPTFQREKLMANRKIAKRYTIGNKEYVLLGNLEYKVIERLDKLGYKDKDLDAPAPFNLPYEDPRTKRLHNHIPDFFIHSLNLIISVKDGLENPNTHPNFQKDRVKSILEYKAILNNTDYNFLQVEGEEDVKQLKQLLGAVKDATRKRHRYILPPRVDVMYQIAEDTDSSGSVTEIPFDTLRVSEDGYYISSYEPSLMSTNLVSINEGVFFGKCTEECLEFNLGKIAEDYDFSNNFNSDNHIFEGNILQNLIEATDCETEEEFRELIKEYYMGTFIGGEK